ncbi:hypothetical protein BCV72DRAFT_67927 [Rhizopus microsporus var. microsporus]|nr:hypothetical protein BCV72DRAFT_67927 [Rhizopus microsporus var. microsporus]
MRHLGTALLSGNSILDLSYNVPHAQSSIFSAEHWHPLRKMYSKKPDHAKQLCVNKKASDILSEAESIAKSSLSEASYYIYKYLYKNKKKPTQDEEFILHTYAFVLGFIEYNQQEH